MASKLASWEIDFAKKLESVDTEKRKKAGALLPIVPDRGRWEEFLETARAEWKNWRGNLEMYPTCLVVLFGGLAFYKYDENRFWPYFADLRDGIRTAKSSSHKGLYVVCQAGRYQQLFLLDENGEVVSRDIPRVLGTMKCGPDLAGIPLPAGHNAAVMRVKRQFTEEVKHRQAEREHTLSLTHGQRYVLRELRVLFGTTIDEDLKAQINILEKAFRGPVTTAVNRELNRIRRNGITGQNLLKTLNDLYHHHNMKDWLDRRSLQLEEQPIPKIVCSEALV